MTNQPSSEVRPSAQDLGLKLKTVLTTMMSLLSLLVVLLAGMRRDVLWLWIGFVCCLISGVFIQLFITHIKNDAAAGLR
jgi:hypothetical protein